jgi:hypothetical protein
MLWDKKVNVSINIIVAIAGICLIDLCYIFVIRQPTIYILLTFHNPNLISIFRRLGHLSKESIQLRGTVWFFCNKFIFKVKGCSPPPPPTSWKATPCRLSVAAYSIYSQLSSIAGGHSSIRNLRMHHAVVTGTHLTWWMQKISAKTVGIVTWRTHKVKHWLVIL